YSWSSLRALFFSPPRQSAEERTKALKAWCGLVFDFEKLSSNFRIASGDALPFLASSTATSNARLYVRLLYTGSVDISVRENGRMVGGFVGVPSCKDQPNA